MAKSTKKKAVKKRGRTSKTEHRVLENRYDASDVFKIETDPPPVVTGHMERSIELRGKIDRTLKIIKPGQAFIVADYTKSGVRNILNKHWPEHKFTCVAVPGNDKAVRVYFRR